MDSSLLRWLSEGDPVLRYLVKRDHLFEVTGTDKANALAHPPLRSLVTAVNEKWPPLTSHKSAGHPIHALVFLSELGLGEEELGVGAAIKRIMDSMANEGTFQVNMKITKGHGGTGEEGLGWALCDAPLLSYALIRFGHGGEASVQRSVSTIRTLARENGWPCVTSSSLGGFRGPGRKEDPCPYANLISLRLMAAAGLTDTTEAKAGVGAALQLWSQSWDRHPYMFYMGTDFRKLKVPLIWYDIIHLADVLSLFPLARNDDRTKEIVSIIEGQAAGGEGYVPGSVWTAWKDWDMGQKKQPSRWLAYRIMLIKERMEIKERRAALSTGDRDITVSSPVDESALPSGRRSPSPK